MTSPEGSRYVTGHMQACATIASPSFHTKLRGPAKSGRGTSYFQSSSAGSTNGAGAVRRNADSRKATSFSRSPGPVEVCKGIRGPGENSRRTGTNCGRTDGAGLRGADARGAAIGLDHQMNQRLEAGFGAPAQVSLGFRGIPN